MARAGGSGAFEQVLVNLAVNARDAMPGDGKVTIETENAVLDDAYGMDKVDAVKPGHYVALAVRAPTRAAHVLHVRLQRERHRSPQRLESGVLLVEIVRAGPIGAEGARGA